ncbi:MAG TPA: hypothetical protein VF705_03260, partial [Longimicrobium sp.]
LAYKYRETFDEQHPLAIAVVEDSWERMQRYGVSFVVPVAPIGLGADGFEVNSEVIEAALLIQDTYGSLDSADAFHIAMGLACGVSWFATTDMVWKDVAEINVFCYE